MAMKQFCCGCAVFCCIASDPGQWTRCRDDQSPRRRLNQPLSFRECQCNIPYETASGHRRGSLAQTWHRLCGASDLRGGVSRAPEPIPDPPRDQCPVHV
ncbi:uncharacterized protein LOC143039095 isoform X4 [Oratosquilla oratoria]|uniref:uncharacterized protein LOC143039095 isoform X4 n=1 Tax=Oratosquilla oratoria TaxID=337810 RepID=UPI003F769E47